MTTTLLFRYIYIDIIDFILQFSEDSSKGMIVKLKQIKSTILDLNIINPFFTSRLDTYIYSIDAFFHYPFLGAIFAEVSEPYSNVIKKEITPTF